MAHVEPLARTDLSHLEPVLAGVEASMGFVPNSMMTMAHMPQLTMAFSMLAGVVFGADLRPMMAAYGNIVPADESADEALSPQLVQLIAYAVSLSAGCRYCQAHTSHSGHRQGVNEAKFAQLLNYETSPEFSDAERAVVAVALAAGQVPNEADGSHFQALKQHFSQRQVVQIVAVIALFGFLNRWNDTLATELEAGPIDFATTVLAQTGWAVDKHAGGR
ncbi:MAG: carboxymuconolactone decarboxylase family protein [bacterium]